MPLREFIAILTIAVIIITLSLIFVLIKKLGKKVLVVPIVAVAMLTAVCFVSSILVKNGKMTVSAEFYEPVSTSSFGNGRYISVTINNNNKNIKRTAWYGSQIINVSVKDTSNAKSAVVSTRRSWGPLYNEQIELQVSQDEYDNIFKITENNIEMN